MKLSEFSYDLPKELIAQEGLKNRDGARLMVLRKDGQREHRRVRDLPGFLGEGDVLVLNNTRVLPAKLLGKKDTGGKVDCLVLPDFETNGNSGRENVREALIKGSGVRPGTRMIFSNGGGGPVLEAEVLEKLAGARFLLKFSDAGLIPDHGLPPLPPYIKKSLADADRYQTVYAEKEGSLAAPTAGLHFTPALLEEVRRKGVELVYLTLHIGIGTFAPIRTETVEDWKMHPEYLTVSRQAADLLNAAVTAKRRIFAVGTTSVRALESSATADGKVEAKEGWTDIFIYPGYKFKFPYAGLLTNFHLPESTLLLLVSALAGRENLLSAYAEAVREKYRFYSLGDAMLIFP